MILVPGPDPDASFVAADRRLLAEETGVVEVCPRQGSAARVRFAAALARRLVRARPPFLVLWFASPTYGAIAALLCRALSVPWIVIAGGAEVANRPAIGFGDAREGWRRRATGGVLTGAWRVWAFSAAAAVEIRALTGDRPLPLAVVPPVVDTTFFHPGHAVPSRLDDLPPRPVPLVLSACARLTAVTVRQKGIDRLLEVAKRLPGVTFVVTGTIDDRNPGVGLLCDAAPDNVRFVGFVARDRLRDLYARATVYLQLSDHEGFGVAVAEAIAMGATPVTTDLPALRETLGTRGYRVRSDATPDAVARLLEQVLAAPAPGIEEGWIDIDRRFGPAVRRAAWRALLADAAARPPAALASGPPSGTR